MSALFAGTAVLIPKSLQSTSSAAHDVGLREVFCVWDLEAVKKRKKDSMATKYAVATLLTDDSYLPGALTAVHSLKDVQQGEDVPGTAYETVCLITPETVSVASIRKAKDVFDKVISVDAIESASARELALLGASHLAFRFGKKSEFLCLRLFAGRPDLKATLTKLHLWRLTQYRRIIYLDADTLVIRPILHLFERYARAPISAAPDNGWPDAFNSGFILLSPDQQHFDGLSSMARERGSWECVIDLFGCFASAV